jgi:dinuclear metal center YbgI/SA1388 family protein
MTVQEIYEVINAIAPFSESMDFDNTGILIGDPDAQVSRVLLCLDATQHVLQEAVELGAELIISHHPIIFSPLRRVQKGDRVYEIIRSGISVISAHTNLDKAFPFGVNHALAQALGLQNIQGVIPDGNGYIGFMGELSEEMTPETFGECVKEALGLKFVSYTPAQRTLRKVCVVGGAGGEYWREAAAFGADAFVTGEVKQHEAIDAAAANFALYEAGHYHTEILYRDMLQDVLRERCPGVTFCVSKKERAPMEVL